MSNNKVNKEELLDIGRKLAVISRRDKELYERVKRIAKMRGETLQDVLATGFELYELYTTLESLDPRTLSIAIRLVEHFLERSIDLLVRLGGLLTSEYVRSNILLASELSKATQQPQQLTTETHSPELMVKQLQYNMLYTMIMPLFSTVLNLLSKLGGSQVTLPLPVLPTPSQSKPSFIIEE
jgi:hypothetical protein